MQRQCKIKANKNSTKTKNDKRTNHKGKTTCKQNNKQNKYKK